jgi:putative ABC transport system substrate-binding protein
MRRRAFLAAAVPIGMASGAWAQSTALPHIGYLSGRSLATDRSLLAAFLEGLKASGYVDGRNVVLDVRWADGHYDRVPALAVDLLKSNPSVLVTVGATAVTVAAKTVTSTVPIVFTIGVDPMTLGLVSDLARPTGNMTGMTLLSTSLEAKRLELLRDLVPAARSVAFLVNPAMPNVAEQIRDAQKAATALSLKLQVVKAQEDAEIDPAFAALADDIDGLAVAIDGFLIGRRDRIVARAAARRLPAIYPSREFTDAGGLASYAARWADVYRGAGTYAGRILAGAKPADLPVQEPTNYELVINTKTARMLGLTIPPSILARADETVE